MICRCTGDGARARGVFRSGEKQFLDCHPFWSSYLSFEMEQPLTESDKAAQPRVKPEIKSEFEETFDDEPKDDSSRGRVKYVMRLIRTKSDLPREVIKALGSQYMQYLEERGGPHAMNELLILDFETNGPSSVRAGTGA